MLRDVALSYQPDIVVLQVGWNDFADNLRKRPVVEHAATETGVVAILPPSAAETGVTGWLQSHSAFYLTIAERYSLWRLRRGGSSRLLERVLATTPAEWAATDQLLAMVAAAGRAHGVPVFVVSVPLDVEVQTQRKADAQMTSDRVQAMTRAYGSLSFVDALTPLRSHRSETLFADDADLTAAGHRLVGAAIAAALSRGR